MSATTERKPVALRIPTDTLTRIDRDAHSHGLSRTDYIIRVCTGALPNTTSEAFRRIKALEAAVQRLNANAFE